jgi:hypothetical protein
MEMRMRTLLLAPDDRLALAAYAPPLRAEREADRGALLQALGGPAAIMAAADRLADSDDWSGGFDLHLGVHTND